MKTLVKGAAVALLAIPAMATAQTAPDQSCYSIRYSLDFLDQYPSAPAICQEVKEKDGIKYARMDATVVSTKKNYVVVGFKDVFGNKLANLEVQATPGSKVSIAGKAVEWSSVKTGDKLTFWLPERALHVLPEPGDGIAAPIIFRSSAK